MKPYSKPVVIIRHESTAAERQTPVAGPSSARISMIRDEPSTSTPRLLSLLPRVLDPSTVEIANAEIQFTLPELKSCGTNATCTSSKRGRPNKFIALQNGDIVKQVLPKPDKKDQGKSVSPTRQGRKRKTIENGPPEVDASAASGRRSARRSAGLSQRYKDFQEESNEDDENKEAVNLTGVTIEKVGVPSKL